MSKSSGQPSTPAGDSSNGILGGGGPTGEGQGQAPAVRVPTDENSNEGAATSTATTSASMTTPTNNSKRNRGPVQVAGSTVGTSKRRDHLMSPSYISPVSSTATTPPTQQQQMTSPPPPSQPSSTPASSSNSTSGLSRVPSPVVRTTITSNANVRKNSSGDGYGNADVKQNMAPAANPFFNQHYYDSDGSDGSLILQYAAPVAAPPAVSSTSTSNRDRFPSFDSMASSGSLRYVPTSSHSSPVHHQPPPQQLQQNMAQLNPRLLPYHERRKLLQQRQRQQKMQQQQENPPGRPSFNGQQQYPQQLPPDHQHFIQQQQQQQQFHQQQMIMPPEALAAYQQGMGGPYGMAHGFPAFPQPLQPGFPGPFPQMGSPMYPHPNHHVFQQQPPALQQQPQPPHPQYLPQQARGPIPGQQLPPQQLPQQNIQATDGGGGGGLSPYRTIGKMEASKSRPPSGLKSGQGKRHPTPPHPSQQGPSTMPSNSNFPVHPSLPPSGLFHRPRSHSSSQDYDSPPQHSHSRRKRHSRSRNNSSSSDVPPPPPPPPAPPPNNPYHIRADSTGTVSSLGSIGMGGSRDFDAEDYAANRNNQSGEGQGHTRNGSNGHTRNDSIGSGFFDMIREQWSPQKIKPSPSQNVSDFHRKNQAFLQQSIKDRPIPRSSPVQQQHRRIGSMDRPPASRGTHKRLHSISNDDWQDNGDGAPNSQTISIGDEDAYSGADRGPGSAMSSSDHTDDEHESDRYDFHQEVDERTSLLPPSGISTNEKDGKRSYTEGNHRRSRRSNASSRQHQQLMPPDEHSTRRLDNRTASAMWEEAARKTSKKSRKKRRKGRRKVRHHRAPSDSSEASLGDSMTTEESFDYRQWTKQRAKMLEKERAKLIEQWKAEARAEAEDLYRASEENRWHRRLGRYFDAESALLLNRAFKFFAASEAFIANLPLTIGAVAMAVVTLGVVWFKFAEENLDSCEPVHFHSSQCTFPEFPGCFYCDRTARMYKVAVYFHFGCKGLAGLLAMLCVAKVLLATRVVIDEMSSPTTSSPAGLLCMTTVCVFAGRGLIGQVMVSLAACVHLGLVIWFIYMALAYHIMPEPSWFPNTVGVGLSAVKIWLYYPMPGHLLMAISLSLNFFFFPISLIRVAINEKISATVGWMQMSAPAISLYALTIMAQPSFEEEHPDVTRFQKVHRMVYLPCMHCMAALSILGLFASVHSLWFRWTDFSKRDFSPAHAAFCFPLLSHANAIQAYRGAINSFSGINPGDWRMWILYMYWVFVLVGGTISTIWITARFLYCLPRWTNLDLEDEEEPPAPYDTVMSVSHMVTAGETLRQPFVSPAVLQANETGALVLTRSGGDGRQRYVRTRRMAALGFEPTMNWSEMQRERDVLLEIVGKNPPRRRHRTLSVPGVDFSYGVALGTDNFGVYGRSPTFGETPGRRRADSADPNYFY